MVFVGRDAELAALGEAYAHAREGAPATVLLGGEAGVGKTRLIAEFAAPLAGQAWLLSGDCPQVGENGLAFAPFTAMLRRLLRELGADGFLRLLPRGEPGELGRLLPLLGRPAGDGDPALTRARLFEEFLTLFENLAEDRPLVIVAEDAHWSDRSSRELLDFLIRNQQAAAAFLLVVTYRSDHLHRTHPLRPVLAEWIAGRGRPGWSSAGSAGARWSGSFAACSAASRPPRSSRTSCGAARATRCSSRRCRPGRTRRCPPPSATC
ncbi:ATP-binding protein [Nonomuraea angiospora]|uniref:ATP-binding protein n=1 Tax=Nonomuraea angiospora TaxID=46172 RepID=UPI0033C87CFC